MAHSDDQRRDNGTFAPANEKSVTHGATSERHLAPVRSEARTELEQQAPWMGEPQFAGIAEDVAELAAKRKLVSRWLEREGVLDDEGVPRKAAEFFLKLVRAEGELRHRSGLTPASYASVRRDLASAERSQSLSDLQAQGREIIQQRRNGDEDPDGG